MAEFEEALNNILADPDAMGQIMALAGKLGGGQPGPSPDTPDTPETPETEDAAAEVAAAEQAPPFQLPDLGQIGQLGQLGTLLELFQNRSQGKAENIALLQSLRPFLQIGRAHV